MKNFDPRLFAILVAAFIPVLIIWVLTHELGHYFALRSIGMDAQIHYWYTEPVWVDFSMPSNKELIWVTIAGPLVTIVMGTAGFVLLFVYGRSFRMASRLSAGQWALVLLSFFWIRQVFGVVFWGLDALNIYKRPGWNDEERLAWLMDLPEYTFSIIFCVIALIIMAVTIFRFIPRKQRITFIFSVVTGSTVAYFTWFKWLGKIWLP